MPTFINIHTHHPSVEPKTMSVINAQTASGWMDLSVGNFSVGLHPWYIKQENIDKDFEELAQLAKHPNVLAIGECGLDRLIDLDMNIQEEVFIRQIHLAETLQKPVIIHCVKAFSELIALKKRLNPKVPLIVHGFNNNPQICGQLVQHQFYISLGSALLNSQSNASKNISSIPIQQLFLETDDKICFISTIFAHASTYLTQPVEVLQEQILQNFKKVVSADSSVV
ncbi:MULTISPECIES: TatD family hydrolase [unclassified Arcicella]|uniref:TatD family hydrolase n=1 Tax=unclassified Arcicella TaxID=2644986 RepID=UPI0028561CB8|nr:MULTISPECIES: TatD family hydrolase [unclassified Arcicella]MDR6560365.1 TatD DNase family protein [Arcicella sp. BE51]MDR6810029.1 TatD DNase family protein [Arcicella sp. BE140]